MEEIRSSMAPQASASEASQSTELLRRLTDEFRRSGGWMKFLGVLSIIQGIMLVFTIWGILICWLPIWIGWILFKAADDAEIASRGAPARLLDYAMRINRYFTLQGIIALVMIVVVLILLLFVGVSALMFLKGLSSL